MLVYNPSYNVIVHVKARAYLLVVIVALLTVATVVQLLWSLLNSIVQLTGSLSEASLAVYHLYVLYTEKSTSVPSVIVIITGNVQLGQYFVYTDPSIILSTVSLQGQIIFPVILVPDGRLNLFQLLSYSPNSDI